MAHDVTLKIAPKAIKNSDIEFEIKKDNSKLGTVLISKGNIEWLPVGNHVNKKSLSWEKFAALMESEGKDSRTPRSKPTK